jgi:hypothetical protein
VRAGAIAGVKATLNDCIGAAAIGLDERRKVRQLLPLLVPDVLEATTFTDDGVNRLCFIADNSR